MPDEKKDETVLGNLPRARPGRRSDKRTGGGGPKRQPAAGATARRGATSARKAATGGPSSSRPAGDSRARRAPAPEQPAASPSRGPDPVGDAIRLAGRLAEVGLKTAGGLIRRLPGGR